MLCRSMSLIVGSCLYLVCAWVGLICAMVIIATNSSFQVLFRHSQQVGVILGLSFSSIEY